MGNDNAAAQASDSQHQRLGPVKIVKAIEKNEHESAHLTEQLQVVRVIQSEKEYKDWVSRLKNIDDSEARQIFFLPKMHRFETQGYCGSTGIVEISFENCNYVLQKEIANRKTINKRFSQIQLWYILYNLVRAAHRFDGSKMKIGDVHPSNILINEDGQIRIMCQQSLPNQMNNFQKASSSQLNHVYLAPEEMANDALRRCQYPPGVNPNQAEIFSIALCMLVAATLAVDTEIYCIISNSYTVNQATVNGLLSYVHQNYSEFFTSTLQSMLRWDPSQRATSKQLYDQLSPYENSILNLDEFSYMPRTTYQKSIRNDLSLAPPSRHAGPAW